MSQPRGIQGNWRTKCNVVLPMRSWNRKGTLGENKGNNKTRTKHIKIGQLIMTNVPYTTMLKTRETGSELDVNILSLSHVPNSLQPCDGQSSHPLKLDQPSGARWAFYPNLTIKTAIFTGAQ